MSDGEGIGQRLGAGLLLLSSVLQVAAHAREATAREPYVQWHLETLDLELRIAPEDHVLVARGHARLRLVRGAPTSLVLQLPDEMRFDSIEAPPDRPASIGSEGRRATIHLGRVPAEGEVLRVGFRYRSRPQSQLLFAVGPAGAHALEPYRWYPAPSGIDQPACGSTSITVPRGWLALSTGRATERVEGSEGVTETWVVDSPAARGFVAGPYVVGRARTGDRVVAAYLIGRAPERADHHARMLSRAIEALERHFGPLPWPSYAVAELGWVSGQFAVSQPGFSVATSTALSADLVGGVNLSILAHELGHAWWGDHVTCRTPGSSMVNEALAQYSAAMVFEELLGVDHATAFLRFGTASIPRRSAWGYFLNRSAAGGNTEPSLIDGNYELVTTKGAWLYRMLRQRVGDRLFFAVLRDIIARHGGTEDGVSILDIRDAFLSVAPPESGLDVFFEQWLERPGAPIIDASWDDVSDGRGNRARIEIRQYGEPYEFPLDVAVDGPRRSRVQTLRVAHELESFVLESNGPPRRIRIDPEHRLLVWHADAGYGPRPGTARASVYARVTRAVLFVRHRANVTAVAVMSMLVLSAFAWHVRKRRRERQR